MHDRQFEELVRAHRRAVHAYAHSMTGSVHLADDATQETFLKAWRYLDSFGGTGSFEGWLIRICRRCVFDLLKTTATLGGDSVDDSAASVSGPEGPVEVVLLLQELAPAHREVLVMCGLLGYDYAETAAVLDLPLGTVRSRLHRARSNLRALLTRIAKQTA